MFDFSNITPSGLPATGVPAPAQHRVLQQHEKSNGPPKDTLFADVGYPQCEGCGQWYMTGGGELWGYKTFECGECGYVWGEGIAKDQEARTQGGVFFRHREETDERDKLDGESQ